jgi:hypothetical protein
MEPEDFIEALIYAIPFGIIAIIYYLGYLKKTSKGRAFLNKANDLIKKGDLKQGVNLLKESLWKLNEKPELEKLIVNELDRIYQSKNLIFDKNDYLTLIEQYVILYKKGSNKALAEIKKVQYAKKAIIDSMPEIE